MKHINIKNIIATLAVGIALSSCSKDWLETDSTQSVSGDVLYSTTDNVKLAINGIAKIMVQQHNGYNQNFNGEGTMMFMYGEFGGQDMYVTYLASSYYPLMNHSSAYTQDASKIYPSYPWYYYYMIVSGANAIIEKVDAATGSQEEKDFLKAEALTFRAYAFLRLSEIYCQPWIRSNSGDTQGIVLRTKEIANAGDDTDMPLSTLAETYAQIYSDLDNAVSLFQSSGLNREDMYNAATSSVCFPDEQVAHAVYARAALTKTDYSKALSEAKLATSNHPLMSDAEYYEGFCTPNDEWIWGIYNDESETIWYYGWQNYMACNGNTANKGYAVCISRELAEQFPDTDIRKGLFLTESTFLPEGKAYLDVVNTKAGRTTTQFSDKEAQALATAYVKETVPNASTQKFAYASLKFQVTALPAVGCIPMFRTSEMLLIQAEANYHLGNIADAQANLMELNATSGRDAAYTCSTTGSALLDEIKLYRRLELWGEGFSWFDCKRWGDSVERLDVSEGGNFNTYVSGSYGFDESGVADDDFWVWIIPSGETDYNSAIDF